MQVIQSASTEASGPEPDWRLGFIWTISIIAALGGLLFGWDWVVIGGAKPFFERYFEITDNPALSGWVNSCALLGCLAGALIGGTLSDALGRKRPLILAALLFVVSSVGNALADSLASFIAWRMLGGVAIGLASSLSPLYIAEIAPPSMRGRLVSVNQLTIVIGVLGAQLLNWWLVRDLPAGASDGFIASSWYGQEAWRWMFGLTAVPSAIFLVGMLAAPESPRWLAKAGREGEAETVLARLGGLDYAQAALGEICARLSENESRVSLSELGTPAVRRALMLGILLAVFQQWCGINVIFNYAEEIFSDAGYDLSSVVANIAWTGSVNLAFTLVALKVVDRVGRRRLMLVGAISLCAIYAALAACYAAGVTGTPMLLLVLAAIASYAATLAPVTWVIISEIFPNKVRGVAISIAVGALWLAAFVLTYTFPILNAHFGGAGAFALYALICLAGFFYILRSLPETKGKSLEELESVFASPASPHPSNAHLAAS